MTGVLTPLLTGAPRMVNDSPYGLSAKADPETEAPAAPGARP
ncbi:hypothetical protein [Mycolicibacter nonchromogenicus]|nr:hypothetical protein [Mycolicibacter nonchromogenicus]